jgi:hypothetical protein
MILAGDIGSRLILESRVASVKVPSAKACNGVFGCALERSPLCNWE